MKWRKMGLIYAPTGELWWAKSHAYLPTAEVRNDTIRVYFASLDEELFGRVGYVDLKADNPSEIRYLTTDPVIDLGEPGTFDDSGISPSCVLTVNGHKYLYYIGWQRTVRVPYMLFCGLAISSDDGDSFRRYSRTPILERNSDEPFIRSATTIIRESDNYRMWYVSALYWTVVDEKMQPAYIVRYAGSNDGIHWKRQDETCIGFESDDEFGFGRPWVINANGIYRMWYSIRSRSHAYRIGYAESDDGLHWTRKDNEAGIEASESGWDSEMICFPCVVNTGNRCYMFYNGNRHGAAGFGYAVLESDWMP